MSVQVWYSLELCIKASHGGLSVCLSQPSYDWHLTTITLHIWRAAWFPCLWLETQKSSSISTSMHYHSMLHLQALHQVMTAACERPIMSLTPTLSHQWNADVSCPHEASLSAADAAVDNTPSLLPTVSPVQPPSVARPQPAASTTHLPYIHTHTHTRECTHSVSPGRKYDTSTQHVQYTSLTSASAQFSHQPPMAP